MLDTPIGIIGALAMIICVVVIAYQRRRMVDEYRAREAAGRRTE